MMLFQFRRAVIFSGVVITTLMVAIASVIFSGHQMDRLIAQVLPSTSHFQNRQLWQTPQPTSTVSLNQISNSLSPTWTGTNHLDGLSPCNCPVCQGITV